MVAFSEMVITHRGNVAGCSHAATLLALFTLRPLRAAQQIAPTVTPRGLVDAAALQWKGDDPKKVGNCCGQQRHSAR